MALKFNFLILMVVGVITISNAQGTARLVEVNGTLYCTANGGQGANGDATPFFPNATVQVDCSADVVQYSPGNVTTKSNGKYAVSYLIPQPNVTFDSIISNCRIFVLTPLSACNPTLPSALLVSDLRVVETVKLGFLPITITYMIAAGFTLQV